MEWGAISDPTMILKFWEIYLLFFGIPFAVAAILFYWARRLDQA